jgi:guanylate kinase
MKTGKIFIIAAPSGAGKTTVTNETIKRLINKIDITKVITYTTRAPRAGEINGKDYHFISNKDFENKIKNNFFLETTKYSGELYGSPANIINDLKLGKSFIIVTDLVGVKEYKKLLPNAILIWLSVPSLEILKERLIKRGDEKNKIEKRLELAAQELKEADKPRFFDFKIINNIFDQTVAELCKVIETNI